MTALDLVTLTSRERWSRRVTADGVDARPTPGGARQLVPRVLLLDAAALVLAMVGAVLFATEVPVPLAAAVLLAVAVSMVWSGEYVTSMWSTEGIKPGRALRASARVVVGLALAGLIVPALPVRQTAGIALVAGALVALGRAAVGSWMARRRAVGEMRIPVVVCGDSRHIRQFRDAMSRDPAQPFEIVGSQSLDGRTSVEDGIATIPRDWDLAEATEALGAGAVVFLSSAAEHPEEFRHAVWALENRGVQAFSVPAAAPLSAPTVHKIGKTGITALNYRGHLDSRVKCALKVAFDTASAAMLILLLAPVLLGIALAVRAGSPGPVFFRQVRVGHRGRDFTMVKFRTMYTDAEERKAELLAQNVHEGGTLFKIPDDPRVTNVGRFLRRYSLDELPQLFNVLRGDMSLVGPRPPLPDEVANYSREGHRRFRVRPGLTGLWQVSGRSNLDPEESTRLDTHYVEYWSPELDAWILLRTFGAVIRGSGAY